MAAILSVFIFDFFFVPPHLSLTVADTEYLIAFATLFIVGMVISNLTLKAKEQAEAAKNRELQTMALYNLSKDMAKTIEMESLLNMVINHVNITFDAETAIFIKNDTEIKIKSGNPEFPQKEIDRRAIIESFESKKPAGWNTEIEPEADAYYLPLNTANNDFGVLGIKFNNKKLRPTSEQYRLLETFANQIAVAIERVQLSDEAQQAKFLREAEKLHTAFLNSVSHDLRTPLVSISGSLSSILQNPAIDEKSKTALLETAYEESNRLNQIVGDLLDMARLDAGALLINRKPVDIKDLIGATLKQMEKALKNYNITIDIQNDLPEIEIDFILIMKVLTNILDNAAKYSSGKNEIRITAEIVKNFIEIKIIDSGIGIPAPDLKYVFDKFYRVKRQHNYEGTGLGLSVCKGIVEAHNGKIQAENHKGGGTTITISLPL